MSVAPLKRKRQDARAASNVAIVVNCAVTGNRLLAVECHASDTVEALVHKLKETLPNKKGQWKLVKQGSILQRSTSLQSLDLQPGEAVTAVYSEGSFIITGEGYGTSRLWTLASEACLVVSQNEAPLTSRAAEVTCVTLSPDTMRALSTSKDDSRVTLWDTDSGTVLRTFTGSFADFSPDGKFMLVGDSFWMNLLNSSSERLHTFRPTSGVPYVSACFSSTGARVLTCSDGGKLELRLCVTGTLENQYTFGGTVRSACMSPAFEHSILLIGYDSLWYRLGLQGRVEVLRSEDGFELELRREAQGFGDDDEEFHTYWSDALFSSDGQYILAGTCDGGAHLWHGIAGRFDKEYAPFSALQDDGIHFHKTAVAFSKDCTHAVTSGCGAHNLRRIAHLWNCQTRTCTHTFDFDVPVCSVGLSPTGEQLIVGLANGAVRLCSAESGQMVQELQGHTGPVNCVVVPS